MSNGQIIINGFTEAEYMAQLSATPAAPVMTSADWAEIDALGSLDGDELIDLCADASRPARGCAW